MSSIRVQIILFFFFFKQKTAYEIGLGIPAEPLFRSRSASLQRTFKKSFTSFSHSTRNKTRDGLIRVRNIRALNGRFNTSITHAYSIVIGSKHITLNATGGGFLTASKQFRRSEERFSRNAETDLVCRLLLEKKKKNNNKNII